jgi:hypothetical protein
VRSLRPTLVACALAALFFASAPAGQARPDRDVHRFVGSPHADHLAGTGGRDWIRGRRGHDTLTGRRGHDRLYGGIGQDHIRARDGLRDLVHGGPGADICSADRFDVVRSCELVLRPGGSGHGGPRALDDDETGVDAQR